MKKSIKIILIIICLIVFTYSAYNIYSYLYAEYVNKNLSNELIEMAIEKVIDSNDANTQGNVEIIEKTSLPILVDFSLLKQENEDIVGWIYCEGTPINYPVVQSGDNQYYLHRLINGEYNIAGSIFMDYRNNAKLEDNNTIIYGHNMKNNTMFGSLQNYKEQKYFDEHSKMYYFTPERNFEVQLFAGFTISVDSDIYDLAVMKKDEIEGIMKKSDFKSDVNIGEEEKILTLSTCAYDYDGARYVVMGVLREIFI